MKRPVFALSFLLPLLSLSILGCASTSDSRIVTDIENATGDSLVAQVRLRLDNDPITSKLRITAEDNDGVITLTGRIDSSEARLRALSVVRGTPGVRAVIDKTFKY